MVGSRRRVFRFVAGSGLLVAAGPGCGYWQVTDYYGGGEVQVVAESSDDGVGLAGEWTVAGSSAQELADEGMGCPGDAAGLYWPIDSPGQTYGRVWGVQACIELNEDLVAGLPCGERVRWLHLNVIPIRLMATLDEDLQGGLHYESTMDDFPSLGSDSPPLEGSATSEQSWMGGFDCEESEQALFEGGSITVRWSFEEDERQRKRVWVEESFSLEM